MAHADWRSCVRRYGKSIISDEIVSNKTQKSGHTIGAATGIGNLAIFLDESAAKACIPPIGAAP
jgi:hypothetical protein